ncbi:MAG: aminopeptidase N [Myxococcota bacterium]|nr:aminopeptidase N [Myxococcota bacterium]
MKDATPRPTYLSDYREPHYFIDEVELRFDLHEKESFVDATIAFRKNDKEPDPHPLVLNGEGLELLMLAINDIPLGEDQYSVTSELLEIPEVPQATFTLRSRVRIHPEKNTSLEGLYKSGTMFCTQCEAQGFRNITYFLDRPDVMAKYRTTIVADKNKYPVLLSNGNPVDKGGTEDGRHFVTWEDPFKKPAYLFALVAGDLYCHSGTYKTKGGRHVALEIFVEHTDANKCEHALYSLIESMRWDEEVFDLEYDLDIYMIVAVNDFNFGAMENKGLNIFNAKYVLARPETATDSDYAGILGVIGHEYFHNWTGNRVTCRDWFQLSLKEGLTVFRDQEFSSDMTSRAVKRIQEVNYLRKYQFPEDAGPMAHPIRPDSYIEINNFYTSTVYNKGAEIIRMLHTIVGKENFHKGMKLYFQRHDGQAVTTEDFVGAMADASDVDMTQFKRWYCQAGTPKVTVSYSFQPTKGVVKLELQQEGTPTPGQPEKENYVIPVKIGFVQAEGGSAAWSAMQTGDEIWSEVEHEHLVLLTEATTTLVFRGFSGKVVPSLFRDFSAPVHVECPYSEDDLALLMQSDSDSFNRWEAAQKMATAQIVALTDELDKPDTKLPSPTFLDAFGALVKQGLDEVTDPLLLAEMLELPSVAYVFDLCPHIPIHLIHSARERLRLRFAQHSVTDFKEVYEYCVWDGEYTFNSKEAGRRALLNKSLSYWVATGDPEAAKAAKAQFENANNMTDQIGALGALNNNDSSEREAVFDSFYGTWSKEPLVLDKWFVLQATSSRENTFEVVEKLTNHEDFDRRNPNRVRSLLGAFSLENLYHFHRDDGGGYRLLANEIKTLNGINPQVAGRLSRAFGVYPKLDENRRTLLKEVLVDLLKVDDLSKDVFEIVKKTLESCPS